MSSRPLKWMVLGPVLALLLVGYSFGGKLPVPPAGQQAQMWSHVDYDPKLTDPFFDIDEWYCRYGTVSASCQKGKPVIRREADGDPESPFELEKLRCKCKDCEICRDGEPIVKITAKCYSTSFGVKHPIHFCEGKFVDANRIDLLIQSDTMAYNDKLVIQIRDRVFACRYKTVYPVRTNPDAHLIWTTKWQKLTLDRKAHQKGNVIKGRIEFECLQEPTNPKYIEKWGRSLRTIKVYGVFKTIVQ
ncbi:MAG: hypothetical protein V1792_11650 [Pseudomonadota bacterium]